MNRSSMFICRYNSKQLCKKKFVKEVNLNKCWLFIFRRQNPIRLIIILLLLSPLSVFSQNSSNRLSINTDYGAIAYNGELGNQIFKISDWQSTYRIGLGFSLSPSFNLGINSSYSFLDVVGPDTFSYTMKANLYDFMGYFEYKIANGYILNEHSLFQPYLKSEVGLITGNTWGKSMDNKGADYRIPIQNIGITIGAGVKIAFNEKFNGHFELNNISMIAEGIDGATRDKSKDLIIAARFGVSYLFGIKVDSDKDGVINKKDLCPNTPINVSVDMNGCPIDSDGDSIADYLDRCPDEMGPKFLMGCPDTDGDSISNIDDKCPEEPGTKEFYGCPAPKTEEIKIIENTLPKGFTLDRDEDGIADYIDECPDIPGKLEDKGCPPIANVSIWRTDIKAPSVHFTSGGTFITDFSKDRLNRLINLLDENPNLKVWLFGHSDATGPSDANQTISEIRVKVVMDYLIEYGINPNRIFTIGFGETFPVSFGRTNEDLLLNRRVDFYLFEFE